jgi:hypothetical protein
MKKLIFTLLLTFITSLSIAQDIYLRSKEILIGKRIDGKLELIESNPSNVLIELGNNKLTIFTKDKQTYRAISKKIVNDNKVVWYCLNSDGLTCNVYVIFDEETLSEYDWKIAVEFSDYSWVYICKME